MPVFPSAGAGTVSHLPCKLVDGRRTRWTARGAARCAVRCSLRKSCLLISHRHTHLYNTHSHTYTQKHTRLKITSRRPDVFLLRRSMWEENFDTEHEVGRKLDYSPVSWREYFDQMEDVSVGPADSRDVFRIYKAGSDGPLLVLLHGGGHSALSWAVFTTAIASRVTCRVLAMDLRGHGATLVRLSDDFSTQTMSSDVANVIRACYGETPPPIVLIGHGVGGAIAVHTASNMLLPTTVGLVAIDVVEGSAMDALHSIQNFLKGRPKSFKSMDHAIEWSVKSGQIRNLESARVSMVGQIKRCEVEEADTLEQASPVTDVVVERNEEFYDQSYVNDKENAASEVSLSEGQSVYKWRIDLSKSEKYWDGWFRGTSNLFLACNLPKLLLLAGIDRLDRDLTIGQMQGKFMMQVLPPCGHAVQEDKPEKVAEAVAAFLLRHKFAEARRESRRQEIRSCSFRDD
ncbi:protein phosphatase methylesterase 1-like isoform X2 [Toxotes jaculatrix]|uniref:protein phosphatase methylesterase 1-like isoform X2 n=1 Tax=Toxotes jaculatrix TaxID=941984 RepID=UPI001B3B0770|nr:protein phosphatase methylesterase 1-like isoform X2 [Toxotes jaculatrix]